MITLIGNLKGGTGKSTVTFNLAVWLAAQQKAVTVFDLDPQATLSDVIDVRCSEKYDPKITIKQDLSELTTNNKTEILIDVGTADMDAFTSAVTIADRIVIPITPSQADIWSTQRFMKIVRDSNTQKTTPKLFGFINRADTHRGVRETDEAAQAIKGLNDLALVDIRWYQRTAYRRSFSEGLAVFELEPRSKAATEVNQLATILYSSLFIVDGVH
ncbi:MAG: AAA family ATPase [Gammaproteobacteria bacterium]